MLLSNFKFVKILTVPVLTNKKNKADIHGSFFTKMIFNFLIYFNLINSINNANLKKLIIKKIYSSKKDTINFLNPIFLNIPRSLFLDRILRFIYD